MMRIPSLLAMLLITSGCSSAESLRFTSAAADYAKPGAPVELSYAFANTPSTGANAEIVLQFKSRAPIDSMTTAVTVSDGMQLQKNLQAMTQSMQFKQRQAMAVEDRVAVVPAGEGTYYLNVFVETMVNGNKLGRAFAIPVVVGNANANQKPKHPVVTDADGNRIIELPAEQP